MTPAMKLAGSAVAIIAVIAGSLALVGDGDGVGSGPTSSPHPSSLATPTDQPTPVPSPFDPFDPTIYATWETYTSNIYGTRIGHPAGWTVVPATRSWDLETDAADFLTDAADAFVQPDGNLRVSVWTVPVEPGTTLRDWVEAYCELNTTPCGDLDERREPAFREVRDQHRAGVLIEFEDDVQAFMPSWAYDAGPDAMWTQSASAQGGEIIVIAAWRSADVYGARDLVDGFSLQLCPDCDAP